MSDHNIDDIALPSGVKGMTKYKGTKSGGIFRTPKSGTPAHVKASLAYNDLLSYYKSKHLEPIRNGKIKWVYLKNNPFHLDAVLTRDMMIPKN